MPPLIYTLGSKKIEGASHFPLIQINNIETNIDFSKYNLLIFTSQNALLSIESKKEHWINKKILTIGEATKKLAESMGAKDILCPKNNNATSMIEQYSLAIKDSKAIYLRAKKISTDIKSILENKNIHISEQIVYESIFNRDITNNKQPIKGSWIIISSPFIFKCFNENCDTKDYKIILFGKKIQQFIPSNIEYLLSPKDTLRDTVSFFKQQNSR